MKYFITILTFLSTFLFADSFDVKDISENKLSSYMSYIKLNNITDINPYDIIFSEKFEQIKNPNLGLNFEDAIWTKVELKNSSKDDISIFLLNTIPLTQKIDIFVFENDKLVRESTIDLLETTKKDYLYNRFNTFELLIKPENEYKILTKLYNPKGRIDTEWMIMSKDTFNHFLFKDSLIWGMIFGIFFILFVLLVLFYFIFKNKSFLSYLFYMLIFWVYLFVNNGFSTIVFQNGKLDLILSHISGYSIVIFYILFLDEYLNLSKNKKYPILLKSIYLYGLYLALTSWVIIFSPIVYSFDNLYFLLTLVTLFVLLFITAKESIKTRNLPIFYIFGQLSLLFGYLFLFFYSLQLLPIQASNQQFLGIFASIEMMFFTMAIFFKIKKMVEMKEKNEKLILSQSHFSTIGQTLRNISHQWKVPIVRIGTLITELEAVLYKKQISNNRIDEIFEHMRNSTEFMKNTITEFSNFYSNDNHKIKFQILDEINDVKILLFEKMKFLNFEILYDITNIQNIQLLGNPKTFAHICMIIIDNAIDIANQRQIKNPWIKISVKMNKKHLIIDFEDNCGGISQKPINKVFELEISSHDEKNRGIGLSIAKMLVEQKLYGEINIKNSINGAVFSLVLAI